MYLSPVFRDVVWGGTDAVKILYSGAAGRYFVRLLLVTLAINRVCGEDI